MRVPQFIELSQTMEPVLVREALRGLSQNQAEISPKFFYDSLGSRLFDAITELAVYYPTRTEAKILQQSGPQMADEIRRRIGAAPSLLDVGAGNCAKAARLFPMLQPGAYVAIDISTEFLRQSLYCLQREHPDMTLFGLGLDFSAGFVLPPELQLSESSGKLLFYPGSSIGNFSPEQAHQLIQTMRVAAGGTGAMLIGVDLVKQVDLLEAAYDDELGVTAAFNRNALLHLNRLISANFQVSDWDHVAYFNPTLSRIEMHLEARHAVEVCWAGGSRRFADRERIHTENSYKWTIMGFKSLLSQAGWRDIVHWSDARGWFAVFLAST